MKITDKVKLDNEEKHPGYKHYHESEDIFSKDHITDIDPEKLLENTLNTHTCINEELLRKKSDKALDDLDVPGSELDDELESIGAEDEENNYYSIGGDNHNDLEEDKS